MATNNIIYKITALDLLTPSLRNINREADKLDDNMRKVNRSSSSMGSGMVKSLSLVKTAIVAVVAAGAYQFGKMVIDSGKGVENMRAALTTSLGDVALANKVIKQSMEDASKTPLEFEQVAKANQLFISAGESIDQARSSTLNLANALAGATGAIKQEDWTNLIVNLQTIRAAGKATAQDIKQFTTRAIDINTLVFQAYGKTLKELQDSGKNAADVIEDALKKAGEAGGPYFNALENSMNTLDGMISVVKDKFKTFAVEIYDENRDTFIGVVKLISEGFTNAMPAIKNIIDGLKTAFLFLKPIFVAVIDAFNKIKDNVSKNSEFFTKIVENIIRLREPLIDIIGLIADVITTTIDMFAWLEKNFKLFTSITDSIIMLVDIIKPLWELIKDIVSLVADIITADWESAWDNFVKGASDLWEALKKIWDLLTDNRPVHFATGAGGDFGPDTKTVASTIQDQIKKPKLPELPKTPKATKGISGPKITTINISMENLIKTFTVQPASMKEGANDIKNLVVTALSQALNDSQLIVK